MISSFLYGDGTEEMRMGLVVGEGDGGAERKIHPRSRSSLNAPKSTPVTNLFLNIHNNAKLKR